MVLEDCEDNADACIPLSVNCTADMVKKVIEYAEHYKERDPDGPLVDYVSEVPEWDQEFTNSLSNGKDFDDDIHFIKSLLTVCDYLMYNQMTELLCYHIAYHFIRGKPREEAKRVFDILEGK